MIAKSQGQHSEMMAILQPKGHTARKGAALI
eukprot:SAG22_NODE_1820_length_3514_cov_2.304539_5_plen_31_part_00